VNIDLGGRVAVVTGGSRGIGLEIARVLVGSGARVAIVARDPARVAESAAALGDQCIGLACNVADATQVQAAVTEIEHRLGPIDVLVNNAGLTHDNLLARLSEHDWDEVLNVNLKGPFLFTKHVTRGMMKRRSGRVVNITSIVGLMGNKGQANYAASKAGIIGFTKAVARELASRNVLVNAVAPGFIDTDMTRALPGAARDALTAQIPLGRLGQGTDVAHTVLFLASDLAGYITGQVFVVDGGMVM